MVHWCFRQLSFIIPLLLIFCLQESSIVEIYSSWKLVFQQIRFTRMPSFMETRYLCAASIMSDRINSTKITHIF